MSERTTFSHPLTVYFEGAAVAFGLMGMAEAIRHFSEVRQDTEIDDRLRRYESLKVEILRLQADGHIPARITDAERADWAYGNAVIESELVTREMAWRATRK